jgi:2-methylcitrate dehydratase PrpD
VRPGRCPPVSGTASPLWAPIASARSRLRPTPTTRPPRRPPREDDRTSAQTRELIDFVVETPSADVPAEVLHESTRCLLDFVGLVVGASGAPAPTIAAAQLAALGGERQAAVLGTATRLRVTDAALVNGVAGHAFDFDDTHVPTILHPTTPLYAAGLALAEWKGSRGIDLIASHALGYELAARASNAIYPEHYDVGWHMTGTTGPLAAAGASSRLLGLDAAAAVAAVSIAATEAFGHREQFGTMTKPFHAGRAASAGMFAALLASGGFTAAPDPLQGRRGMFAVMSTRSTPEDLTVGLGSRWQIFDNGVKPYACGVVTHPAIDAVRQLASVHGLAADDIERIDLRVHPLVLELTGRTEPRTGLEGKFSVSFACAIALLEGTAGEHQFSDANVVDPRVRDLMSRITPNAGTEIDHTEAVAVGHTRDGRQIEVVIEHATGTPQNRMTDSELAAKFHGLVEPVLGAAQAAELEAAVWKVAELDDLSQLVELASQR